jgi:hypothetical protein
MIQLEKAMGASKIIVVQTAREAERAYGVLLESLRGSRKVVSVDCEGTTRQDGGEVRCALMVQIASHSVVVVEVPEGAPYHGRLSQQARALLQDTKVLKVLHAGGNDTDVLPVNVEPTVDVQEWVTHFGGMAKMPLHDVLTACDPQARVWSKQSFKKNRWYLLKSGQAMLAANGFKQYAAADAWGTLQAFYFMVQANNGDWPVLPLQRAFASIALSSTASIEVAATATASMSEPSFMSFQYQERLVRIIV